MLYCFVAFAGKARAGVGQCERQSAESFVCDAEFSVWARSGATFPMDDACFVLGNVAGATSGPRERVPEHFALGPVLGAQDGFSLHLGADWGSASRATEHFALGCNDSVPLPNAWEQSGKGNVGESLAGERGAGLRLGTFFSGWETPIHALAKLGIEKKSVLHMFSVEKDLACQRLIKQNFEPQRMYGDVAELDIEAMGEVNLVVAGPPCEPFTPNGLRKGQADPRGWLVQHVLDYVCHFHPQAVVLENSDKLLVDRKHRGVIQHIHETLRAAGYMVQSQVLDTAVHGALPQHRARCYVVGVLSNLVRASEFAFPAPREPIPLSDILDMSLVNPVGTEPRSETGRRNLRRGIEAMERRGVRPRKRLCVVDVGCGPNRRPSCFLEKCPSITRGRAGAGGYWITKLRRRATLEELCRLQGVELSSLDISGLSKRQVGMMAGNAMSASLLCRIFSKLLPAAGLARDCVDPYDT